MVRLLVVLAGLTASALGLAVVLRPGVAELSAPPTAEVEIERMTWVEVRQAMRAGKTTVIIPTGGTEQNGPHMVLGKHNFIVAETARRIARRLGDALVAPVIAYVPEGDIDVHEGHMAFPGTISLPAPAFAALLEAAARSFRAHGFKTVVFLGDSGGNQAAQARVAADLNARWAGAGVRVIHAANYYAANGGIDWLVAQGESRSAIGRHAGIQDTSELLAVFDAGVHMERARPGTDPTGEPAGVDGDPTRATAAYGEVLLKLKVDAAVAEIRRLRAAPLTR